jgi:glutaredoxin 3
MLAARHIDLYTAGCPICEDAAETVRRLAAPEQTVTVHDLRDEPVAARAASLGVRAVPAVVVDGRLAGCCTGGVSEEALRAEGVGA